MRAAIKNWVFRLLGKQPGAVVVGFASGPPELAARMWAEVVGLTPGYRHVWITPQECRDAEAVRARLRGLRIGQAAVLFTGDQEYTWMRWLAFRLAPGRILAYNRRLERHQLSWSSWLASLLFLRGVPLDRIFLRPKWLIPWKKDRSVYPAGWRESDGRAFRPGRPRVAVVSPYFPYPLSHGGAVRMFALIREMALHFDVVLLSFTDRAEDDAGPLLRYCSKVYAVQKPRYREPRWSTLVPPEVAEFQSPAMWEALDRARRELGIDLVQVEYTQMAPYAGDILVEHDVTFELYRQIRARAGTFSAWWDHWRWVRFERRWVRRYRRVVTMSDQDRKLLGGANVTVIPNGVDLERFIPEAEQAGEQLLFIGSFRHFPNVVAFRFFFEQVWPTVRAALPRARFTVVAGPDPELYWRANTGDRELPGGDRMTLHGFVSQVPPLYRDANLVLVPTLVSAGTNLKVLEALAMERAVISTTSGCAGLGLAHGQTVWIADDPADFAAGVLRLLSDGELRRAIARNGRLYAQRHFDWRRLGGLQRGLFRELLPDTWTFRPLREDDLDAIRAIQAAAPESSQWSREDYLSFDCVVAETGGVIAGFLVSRGLGPEEREILNIAVDPEFRRMGLATRLIQHELRRPAVEYFLEVRESNQGARALYRGLGFADVGVRPGYYDDPPEAGIVMKIHS